MILAGYEMHVAPATTMRKVSLYAARFIKHFEFTCF